MHIREKIFLQFFSSWSLMPFALYLAHISGIAQVPEFITAILVIASIAPIQVYMNEVFAPVVVKNGQNLDIRHALEVGAAVVILTGWLVYRIHADIFSSALILVYAQGYVWFSYKASKSVLEYQARSIIGGRYSYIIGSIVPLSFVLILLLYWLLSYIGSCNPSLLYLLILFPNCAQYLYTQYGWMPKAKSLCVFNEKSQKRSSFTELFLFLTAMLMAMSAQHWKIELSKVAVGFSALSIYLISPFSSMWLIYAKSRFMTKHVVYQFSIIFWMIPSFVVLTLFLAVESVWSIFLLALVTQVLTFKFITDIRLKIIERD